MTGEEIRLAAERYIDEPISSDDAVEGINQAIDWLGDRACVWDEVAINAISNMWYELPSDCVGLVDVLASDYKKARYIKKDNHIMFFDDGEYKVKYRKMPEKIASLNDEPKLHQIFHRVLAWGLAAWWKLKDDYEDQDGIRLLTKFEQEAIYAAAVLRRNGTWPLKITVIR